MIHNPGTTAIDIGSHHILAFEVVDMDPLNPDIISPPT